MYTHKDIEYKSIFVVNCIKERTLRVSNGELLLEEVQDKKVLTKLPFQKILALFVIGHISITTALVDKCKQYNVALVVMKPTLRPVFYWALAAEANFLLRQKQYLFDKEDISIAKSLMINKIENQYSLLAKTRKKNELTSLAKEGCINALSLIPSTHDYKSLLGIEGSVAKLFFAAYFEELNWKSRRPRTKSDAINATLDIGYTILFNFMEVYARMFGFDPYMGVYHRLWFKRKSLICDLMEPFRCLIDATTRKGCNLNQFKESDFNILKGEYKLKIEKNIEYCTAFYEVLVDRKMDIFKYVQAYYRCFMQNKGIENYPQFIV
ncbi:type V CRISPR-associated endonuclease Cas1 [Bacteroides graminisolvens]|uniref:type V CRISPR-associated endonuclease Cas1 n=1 Tax=Bacteroides graminisolvens TaxID=477666 RepID=UPI00240A3E6B|nr:type V CRISPR-associated endonuclease Cas1 [Bacteroides graminisolvens]